MSLWLVKVIFSVSLETECSTEAAISEGPGLNPRLLGMRPTGLHLRSGALVRLLQLILKLQYSLQKVFTFSWYKPIPLNGVYRALRTQSLCFHIVYSTLNSNQNHARCCQNISTSCSLEQLQVVTCEGTV